MVFSSFTFLVFFLPFTIGAYFLLPHKYRNMFLLIMSLIFYLWGSPQYVLVMVGVIIINYFIGIQINKSQEIVSGGGVRAKYLLILGICINVVVLFVFKYLSFAVNNISNFISSIGFDGWSYLDIALPVGISFYIFQSISYLVDVYRRQVPVQKNFKNLALYISMFPQLVAGPIVRYNTIVKDLESERRITLDAFTLGLQIFLIGLAKKVLIANNMAIVADNVFSQSPEYISAITAWLGAVCYALQIYFDFSGYSDMAIGLGIIFGFKFPLNFNYPYIALSITDFWRRWHISLSSWFRDYVYISLGGNRVKVSRMYINLFIVFAITGLWHGANWTFLAWGLFHGLFLVIEKITGFHKIERFKIIRWAITMVIVLIGWVIFRADNISYAVKYLATMFGFGFSGILLFDYSMLLEKASFIVMMIITFIGATPIIKNTIFKGVDAFNPQKVALPLFAFQCGILVVSLFFVYVFLANSSYNPFFYFRFSSRLMDKFIKILFII